MCCLCACVAVAVCALFVCECACVCACVRVCVCVKRVLLTFAVGLSSPPIKTFTFFVFYSHFFSSSVFLLDFSSSSSFPLIFASLVCLCYLEIAIQPKSALLILSILMRCQPDLKKQKFQVQFQFLQQIIDC